jgi:pyruvate kinase
MSEFARAFFEAAKEAAGRTPVANTVTRAQVIEQFTMHLPSIRPSFHEDNGNERIHYENVVAAVLYYAASPYDQFWKCVLTMEQMTVVRAYRDIVSEVKNNNYQILKNPTAGPFLPMIRNLEKQEVI